MDRGLIHIYCGDGKGKTTCAAGLAVRCAGAGGNVLWFQFLKKDNSSERKSLEQLHGVTVLPGYSKIKFSFQMTEEEKTQAKVFYRDKIQEITKLVQENKYDLLILDEAMGAIQTGMAEEEELYQFLMHRPTGLEVVLTGRNPSKRMLECADYVSNIEKVKHPFDKGIAARKMIEY